MAAAHRSGFSLMERVALWQTLAPLMTRGRLLTYGMVCVFLLVLAGWLAEDLVRGRRQILDDRAKMVLQKSQIIGQSLGTTLLSADYVLRDVTERINQTDLRYPDPDPVHRLRMRMLLRSKVDTVPGIFGMALYNKDCIFTANSNAYGIGFQTEPKLCHLRQALSYQPGNDTLHLQYVPAENSPAQRAVIALSRNLPAPPGEFVGGAVAVVDMTYVQAWLDSFEVTEGDVLALVDTAGTVLARNPYIPEVIGQVNQEEGFRDWWPLQAASGTLEAQSPYDRYSRIYGISGALNFPFKVVVGTDRQRTLAEWQRRAWQLTGGFLGLLVLAGWVAYSHLLGLYQHESMRQLATTDALTGLANRRHWMDGSLRALAQAQRQGKPLSMLMLDIDHFKKVNDTWGHPTGDVVLQALAQTLQATGRTYDVIGRLGGEEFAMTLPDTDMAGAQALADRVRTHVEACQEAHTPEGEPITFTVSVGVATLASEDDALGALLIRADKALYQAKQAGRNCIACVG